MEHGDNILEAADLRLEYRRRRQPPVQVLNGVSLSLGAGEWLAIVGPSGSGKSTLLYCLSGLMRPSSGSVRVCGDEISRMSSRQLASLRRGRVGFVFQSYNLIPSLSVKENVQLVSTLAGTGKGWRDPLADVGLLDKANQAPDQLSGGECQRVAIARALAASPDILFVDEPTGALDTQTGAAVLSLLASTVSADHSLVMVTHDIHAASLADRAIVLRDGLIVGEIRDPTEDALFDAIRIAESPGRCL